VGKCQVRAPLVPVLVVIECAQGPAYQRMRRVCHRQRLVRTRMRHWVLASISTDGAISRPRRHSLAREAEAGKGCLEIEVQGERCGGWCLDTATALVCMEGGVRLRPCGGSDMPSDKILRQTIVPKCEEASEMQKGAGREIP
jgi:hypothetical protein